MKLFLPFRMKAIPLGKNLNKMAFRDMYTASFFVPEQRDARVPLRPTAMVPNTGGFAID